MKNKNRIAIKKKILSKYKRGKTLTKWEQKKSDSIYREILLDDLRMQNPEFRKIAALSEEDFLKHIAQNFESSDINVTPNVSVNMMVDFYLWAKSQYGKDKARQAITLQEKIDFLNRFKNKRFKSPPNFEQYLRNIRTLQKDYPDIKGRSSARKDLKRKTRVWKRGAMKIEPIFVTHEIANSLSMMRAFWGSKQSRSKTLSNIRAKLKRAKKEGFL